MITFKDRSDKKELLDRNHIPFDDIKRNMIELDIINRQLGGHDITLDGIVALIRNKVHFNDQLHIVEIGTGGGDNLKAIWKWSKKINMPVQLSGIDINAECITYAKGKNRHENIAFIHSDYRHASLNQKPDIIFSSLFCHHFSNEELVFMLKWMQQNSRMGFFINDLHRHPLAYYSIKLITSLFSKSYLVKNDAPLSVLRGFKKREWENIFAAAGIHNFKIQWRWAFRWLITYSND
ncbi:MAG TPA: methyltransferase domain-containing protein [Flavisolibacter sp.]|nr:methyltransferase domain-containing protein [Flavisolibacter sp.]